MKVLLAKPVEALGEIGEVVEVARGFARNYLFPQRLAVEPTEHNVQKLQKAKNEREIELRNREEQARAVQEQLNGLTFTFKRTAQAGGTLYGSVRLEDISGAVEEQTGHALERDRVKLEAPIDTLGTFPVTLSIYKDITADVTVVVETDGATPPPSEPAEELAAEEPVAEATEDHSVEETSVEDSAEEVAEGDAGQEESDTEGDTNT
jgi:large subunit ribosomal protein L9